MRVPGPVHSPIGEQVVTMNSPATKTLTAHAERLGVTAVRITERGRDVVSWGDVARPVPVHSIRKSLISALFGQLHDRGALRLDTTIGELGIDDNPSLTDTEKTATIEDLLTARSGVYLPVENPSDGPLATVSGPPRPARGEHRPGEFWQYNNWDFNVAGNIYERLTHKSVFLAFEHGLARPLQMTDWDVFEHSSYHYRNDVLGGDMRYANYAFMLSARDLQRVGELFLQQGRWQDTQLLSPAWIEKSTKAHATTPLPGLLGTYGYFWWVAGPQDELPQLGLPNGTYSAFGYGGNFLTVLPTLGTVVCVLNDTGVELSSGDYSTFLSHVVRELG
jgi:CubicO group peptidase (beta-lactamase class C family)